MSEPKSVTVAKASADAMEIHIDSLKHMIAGDERALTYNSAIAFSEEDTPESILISERAMREYLYARIDFNKSALADFQEAHDKICKFTW